MGGEGRTIKNIVYVNLIKKTIVTKKTNLIELEYHNHHKKRLTGNKNNCTPTSLPKKFPNYLKKILLLLFTSVETMLKSLNKNA